MFVNNLFSRIKNARHLLKLCLRNKLQQEMTHCLRYHSVAFRLINKDISYKYQFSSSIAASSSDEQAHSPSQIYDNTMDFSSLTNGDTELEKKLRILCLELEVMKQEGLQVPSSLTLGQWRSVLNLDSRSKRKKYYKYLFGIEMKRNNEKLKKQLRAQEKQQQKLAAEEENSEDGRMKYGIGHNTFFVRIYDTTMNQLYNNNLIRAMQFGQKIIIDCGYDDHMNRQESLNCAKQIMITFAENRIHNDPFDLYLCNARKDSSTIQQLQKYIPNLYEDYFPLNVTEKSYLDIVPKQDLVYLTPHCRTELREFNHDAVYIVGGIVDKVCSEPLSLAKAKREGLRMAKFPLDLYLQWGGGSGKSLTINQCVNIMLDFRLREDWNYALRHVPRRKLITEEPFSSQLTQKSRDREQKFSTNVKKEPSWKDKNRFPSQKFNTLGIK